jgi:hypothetical protein
MRVVDAALDGLCAEAGRLASARQGERDDAAEGLGRCGRAVGVILSWSRSRRYT